MHIYRCVSKCVCGEKERGGGGASVGRFVSVAMHIIKATGVTAFSLHGSSPTRGNKAAITMTLTGNDKQALSVRSIRAICLVATECGFSL